jgi:hypothetical protein
MHPATPPLPTFKARIEQGLRGLYVTNAGFHGQTLSGLQNIQDRMASIEKTAGKIYEHTSDIQRYAQTDLLGQAIEGVGGGLIRTVVAFGVDKLPWQGAAELVRLGGAAANLMFLFQNMANKGSMFAKWAGPIGSIVGEALGVIAAIFEMFNPKAKSMADELKDALSAFQGRDNLDRLEGLLDSFALGRANLVKRKADSMTWDEVCDRGNLMGSVEVVFLGAAESYLRREKDTKMDPDVWTDVFSAYLYARNQAMQVVTYALLAMAKFDADGFATENVVLATSVIREILTQCRDFLDTFGEVAVGKGAAWFIGTDSYFREIEKVDDNDATARPGSGTRLALAGDSGHVFHIGDGRKVWAWADAAWKPVAGVTIDEISVLQNGDASFHVFGVDAGKLVWTWWSNDGDAVAPASCPFTIDQAAKVSAVRIAATADALYVLDASSQLHMIDRTSSRMVDALVVAKPTLVSADLAYVYIANKTTIWRKTILDAPYSGTPWEMVAGPPAGVTGNAETNIRDLSAGGDGSLQIVSGDKIYSLFDGTWTRLGVDLARAVVKVPFRAYEQFQALQSSVTAFETALDKLNQWPLTTLTPPLLQEVHVGAGFSPQHSKLRTGGTVRLIWDSGVTGAVEIVKPVSATRDETIATSSGPRFEHVFSTGGVYVIKGGPHHAIGTIKVEDLEPTT